MKPIKYLTITAYRWYVVEHHYKSMEPTRMIEILEAMKDMAFVDWHRLRRINKVIKEIESNYEVQTLR